jgi:hypothetical protein
MAEAKHPIRQIIADDKQTAGEVIDAASRELREGMIFLGEDITGTPTVARSFNRWKERHQQALESLRRDLYFFKVDATLQTPREGVEHRKFLITKARINTGLSDGDWAVVGWTAPITAQLIKREIGHTFEFQAERYKPNYAVEIGCSAEYGAILPHVVDTTYSLRDGELYVSDERSLDVDVATPPRAAPPSTYEAAEDFGLTEIIELADVTQREAMHLPFKESVLIEGPPGSGKTSIGLMRVPCLIDRQWQELELDPKRDDRFHDESTMRVLVLNEEMVDYLNKLTRSIGVQKVPVQTLESFCEKICRNGQTLRGRLVRETPRLTRVKLHPDALQTYWDGFRKRVARIWASNKERLASALEERAGESGKSLWTRLDRWAALVGETVHPDDASELVLNLPNGLRLWRNECRRRLDSIARPKEREKLTRQLNSLRRFALRLARRFFDRHRIVCSVVNAENFGHLCASTVGSDLTSELAKEWMDQARQRRIAESDYVLAAWLATYVSHVPPGSQRQSIGYEQPVLTHVVIDEAQDVSPCHLALIRRLISPDGTITLVGDLHQRVTTLAHFREWSELDIGPITKAVFTVNHRQSKPLGDFIRSLHACLYGSAPAWRSSKRLGPKPRLRRQRGNVRLADAVVAETRFWREKIPNATVGILFHGPRWKGVGSLARKIERGLADTLTRVHQVAGTERAHLLERLTVRLSRPCVGQRALSLTRLL